MTIIQKLFSGKFILAMVAAACIALYSGTICAILYNNPSGELNDIVSFLLGNILGFIGHIVTSYFRKREDNEAGS